VLSVKRLKDVVFFDPAAERKLATLSRDVFRLFAECDLGGEELVSGSAVLE
jgi:hypothetical protein